MIAKPVWELEGSRRVSQVEQEAIEQAPELLFSVVSFAEIGAKAAIGKLSVPDDLREHVLRSGVRVLGLDAQHGLAVAGLPIIIGIRSTGCSSPKLGPTN